MQVIDGLDMETLACVWTSSAKTSMPRKPRSSEVRAPTFCNCVGLFTLPAMFGGEEPCNPQLVVGIHP